MAVDGKWEHDDQYADGRADRRWDLKVDGAALTGTMTGNMGSVEIQNGLVDGRRGEMSANVTDADQCWNSDGKVDGDNLAGNVSRFFGSSTFRNARLKTPMRNLLAAAFMVSRSLRRGRGPDGTAPVTGAGRLRYKHYRRR
ncbi:MAG: hypothetical protein R3C42_09530 [Parvularculaceae bacterium]